MQDMEFTIEEGKLFMLQTRNGKRTAAAALRIACDMVDEGQISTDKAVKMIDPKQIDALLHPQFDADDLSAATLIGKGLPASPGAAVGKVAFTAETPRLRRQEGETVVLVRHETTPEDIEGMHHAAGHSDRPRRHDVHAAVVARGMGTCCVAGCGDIQYRRDGKSFSVGGKTYTRRRLDQPRRLDRQRVRRQDRDAIRRDLRRLRPLMEWADELRTMKVRTNADTPHDAAGARVRRRRHRPVPHRAHVLRGRPDRRDAAR